MFLIQTLLDGNVKWVLNTFKIRLPVLKIIFAFREGLKKVVRVFELVNNTDGICLINLTMCFNAVLSLILQEKGKAITYSVDLEVRHNNTEESVLFCKKKQLIY